MMNSYRNENDLYWEAKRRVRLRAKFFKHLYIFIIVNATLVFFSLFRGRVFTPFPVIFFWGIGLVFHYLKVFGIPGSGILSRDWEDREVRKEMEKMSHKPTRKPESEELELKELRKNYDESEFV